MSQNILSDIVDINVGGILYTTTTPTLTKYADSMLATMFSASWRNSRNMHNGHFFIDRDGEMFKYVLNFLRSGHLNLEKDFDDFERLEIEADFYQISDFIKAVYQLKSKRNKKVDKSGVYLELLDCEETAYFYRFYSDPPKGINTELKNSGIVLSGPKYILLTLPLPVKSIKELQGCESEYRTINVSSCNGFKMSLIHHLNSANWTLLDTSFSNSTNSEGSYMVHKYLWHLS